MAIGRRHKSTQITQPIYRKCLINVIVYNGIYVPTRIDCCQGTIFKQMSSAYFGNIDRCRSKTSLIMDDIVYTGNPPFFVVATRYSWNKNENWLKIKINNRSPIKQNVINHWTSGPESCGKTHSVYGHS